MSSKNKEVNNNVSSKNNKKMTKKVNGKKISPRASPQTTTLEDNDDAIFDPIADIKSSSNKSDSNQKSNNNNNSISLAVKSEDKIETNEKAPDKKDNNTSADSISKESNDGTNKAEDSTSNSEPPPPQGMESVVIDSQESHPLVDPDDDDHFDAKPASALSKVESAIAKAKEAAAANIKDLSPVKNNDNIDVSVSEPSPAVIDKPSESIVKIGDLVNTPYGIGQVKAIRGDGIVAITPTQWRLANDSIPTFYMMGNNPPPNTPTFNSINTKATTPEKELFNPSEGFGGGGSTPVAKPNSSCVCF